MSVIAILVSDVHLAHTPPIARSAEKDWYMAMARPLLQLANIQREHPKAVVVYGGDIFDRPNSPPELINFAFKWLPAGYAVAGQHDLPNHNFQDIHKSAYWTLVRGGKLKHINPGQPYWIKKHNLCIHGASWEQEIRAVKDAESDYAQLKDTINLAVIHKYIWNRNHGFPGAPQTNHARTLSKELEKLGYQAALFGDNHIGFGYHINSVDIVNPGSLMNRNSDQEHRQPSIGLLQDNGEIYLHYLDTSKDVWLGATSIKKKKETDLSGLMKEFKDVATTIVNFFEELEEAFRENRISKPAQKILKEILEKVKC